MSPLSTIVKPENTSELKLVKDPNSIRVNGLLIHNTKPVTIYNNCLTFRDRDKKLELEGDILKMITNKNYNVEQSKLSDKKIMLDFAKKSISMKKLQAIKIPELDLVYGCLYHQL